MQPTAFCDCWNGEDEQKPGNPDCSCEAKEKIIDWSWKIPEGAENWVDLCEDNRQVIFHPLFSAGTALVRGDADLESNKHYYWEVKMLTEPYGTDLMIGLGSDKLNLTESLYDFRSLLGGNNESYGLSYTGALCQNGRVTADCAGFCQGSVIGVRIDMMKGTVEFYLNREPQGIAFNDLHRHKILFPMLCSTAAQSAMRLVYASSWEESLLTAAAKSLALTGDHTRFLNTLPPGLKKIMKSQFWMLLPSLGVVDEEYEDAGILPSARRREQWNRVW